MVKMIKTVQMTGLYSLKCVWHFLWQFHNLIYASVLCCIFICCNCLNPHPKDRQTISDSPWIFQQCTWIHINSSESSISKGWFEQKGLPLAHFKTATRKKLVVFQTLPWKSKCKHPVLINRLQGDKWIWLLSFLWNEWKAKSKQTKAFICLNLEALKKSQIAGSAEIEDH